MNEDEIKKVVNDEIEKIEKKIDDLTKRLNDKDADAEAQKDKADATIIETTGKSEQLAKISKRREELKEKLEGGQLKADEASNIGIEYRILKKAYEDLLDGLKINL